MRSPCCVLVICALVSTAVAGDCGSLQRLKVKQQWSKAFGSVQRRDDFSKVIWKALFAQDTNLVQLFSRVHGEDFNHPDFQAHSARVLGAFDTLVAVLDEPDTFDLMLGYFKMQHYGLGVSQRHFQLMRNAIFKAVEHTIGRCFDKYAWDACYDVIHKGMT